MAISQIPVSTPSVTTYTSGSGTYTTPAGARFLLVQMCGGGAGGGGGGTGSQTGGTAGGTTTFGSSLLTCNGGKTQSTAPNIGSDGGSATIGVGASGLALTGGNGQGSIYQVGPYAYMAGGIGGANPLGGAGSNVYYNSGGSSGSTNSGAGGGGGGVQNIAGAYAGAGGGAGGYIQAIISSPSSTYSYAVGAGGSAGNGGTSGYAGGAGGSGVIVVTAYF